MKHLTQGLTALVWQRFKPNSDSDPTLLTPSFYNTYPPRPRACWPHEPEDRSAERTQQWYLLAHRLVEILGMFSECLEEG